MRKFIEFQQTPRDQIDALTGVRGFAAIWVALHHALGYLHNPHAIPAPLYNFVGYGWIAVDMFFVLSGFVISYVHSADFPTLSRTQYARFLKIRLARIYPAHFVAMLVWIPVVAVAMFFFPSEQTSAAVKPFSAGTFLFAVTLTNGWGFPNSTGWNGPSWSVGAEWFAYLTFPLLAIAVRRIRAPAIHVAMIAVIVSTMTGCAFLVNGGTQYMLPESATLARVSSEFAVGCCVFGIYASTTNSRGFATIAVVSAVAVVVLAGANVPPIFDFAFILAFAALILGLTRGDSFVHGLLATPSAVYLGKISYSVYLIHYVVLIVLRRITKLAGSGPDPIVTDWLFLSLYLPAVCVAGHVLYRFIEEPARVYLRKRWVTGTRARPEERKQTL